MPCRTEKSEIQCRRTGHALWRWALVLAGPGGGQARHHRLHAPDSGRAGTGADRPLGTSVDVVNVATSPPLQQLTPHDMICRAAAVSSPITSAATLASAAPAGYLDGPSCCMASIARCSVALARRAPSTAPSAYSSCSPAALRAVSNVVCDSRSK